MMKNLLETTAMKITFVLNILMHLVLRENILQRKNIFANIIFVFPKDIKAEEILELMSPEGHKLVFDGIIVKAEDSYDGLSHQVHSMEELRKYIKPDKE